MKVTIKEVTSFEVEVDGKVIGVFSKGTDWNGMTELASANGKVIVAGFDAGIFNGLFSQPKTQELQVVTITPSLIPADKGGECE